MTLLNRPSNGHVPSMVVLWRTARVLGPLPRAKLEAWCRPRADQEQSRIPMTFATWRSLGMLEGDDELVRLASPFEAIGQTDIEALRTAVLDLLLRPDNTPVLFDNATTDENSRASDFVRVACWALAQDPYPLASWKEGRALEEASKQGLELFKGAGRWPSFQEWAYFVGLGVETRHGLVMSPARAIREVLRTAHWSNALPTTEDIALSSFIEDLAKALPVIDGGVYRAQIDNVLRANGHGTEVHQISSSLALALLQLDHEEEIVLTDRAADVATRLSLVGREGHIIRTASHIRRGVPRRMRGGAARAEGAHG